MADEWWKRIGCLLMQVSRFWSLGLADILPWAIWLAAWTTALLSGQTYVGPDDSMIHGEHCSTAMLVATASILQGLQNCM